MRCASLSSPSAPDGAEWLVLPGARLISSRMATASYLDAAAGGMVTGAVFSDDDAAVHAVTQLRESGVREQDISVIASDPVRASLVAGDRAWVPFKHWGGLRAMLARIVARL